MATAGGLTMEMEPGRRVAGCGWMEIKMDRQSAIISSRTVTF